MVKGCYFPNITLNRATLTITNLSHLFSFATTIFHFTKKFYRSRKHLIGNVFHSLAPYGSNGSRE